MIDIVEDAIARREALEDGNRADTNEFAEPRVCLVGYGDRGVKLAEQGWDDRYPDPKYPEATAHCVEGIGTLPRSVTTADQVILVGHATDHELAVSIGDALSDETTSVAVSVPAANEPTRHVGPVDTTIPCGPDDVQELIPRYRTEPETLTDAERSLVEEALETVTVTQNPEQVQEELDRVRQLWEQAKAIKTDSKASLLKQFVDRILREDPDEKILIFTEYTDTLEYLRDEIFADHDVAQVYGDLDQARRRREMEKFEEEANLMLATDAAQEGLNLQFAHIMVNYDLPWNPIRIDQRMGRLHRYGQEHTVEIRNLFFKDTRESEILSLLIEKTDQIESDLGMRSDVMGRILEDIDLDETIMSAIADGTPTNEVVTDVEATIEERRKALTTVENEFLIRDRFDLSEGDEEILDVIERSQHGEVSEDDIEILVREFFDAFDGGIKGVRPGPAREGGDVYQLDVPDVLSGDQVAGRYPMATFTKDVAMEQDDVEFVEGSSESPRLDDGVDLDVCHLVETHVRQVAEADRLEHLLLGRERLVEELGELHVLAAGVGDGEVVDRDGDGRD